MSIEIDRANNALVVASSEKLFGQIKSVAQELDGSAAAQAPSKDGVTPALNRSVFIIDVEHNSPEEVKKLLEQMGITKPQAGDSPGVVGEPVIIVSLASRRALAIVADPRDGESVVALVRSLDAAPLFADQRVSMVRLKTGNATEVVAALDSMLKADPKDGRTSGAAALVEQVRRLNVRRPGVDQKDLELDLSRPIRITADKQTNSVLIASTPANVEALSGVVDMLDRLPIGDAVTVRFFPLANASAQRIALVVKELFNQGDILRQIPATSIKGEPTTEVGKALSGKIAVSVDDRTNALVVAGREEAVALVEILVKQLDGDRAASWVEPRIIHLKNADATKLSGVLKLALVQSATGVAESPEAEALRKQVARLRIVQAGKDPADPSARAEADLVAPLSGIVLIPDPQSNSIITVASPANLNVVQSLVNMLDVPTASASNTVRVFPLQFAAADRVGTMLQGLFKQQVASGVIRAEDDIFVTADTRTNALVVTTSERSFQLVESILAKLDGEGARPLVGLHVIPIPQGNVTLLAPKIERLMRDRIDSVSRAGGIASPRDAFSIVAASDENLKIIQQLIEVLSRNASELDKTAVLDVVVVKNSRAEQLLPALKELYVNKENAARGADSVRVTADPRLNALVVSGTTADLEAIKGIVSRLDSLETSAVTEYKRIELKKADSTEVVRLLKSVLTISSRSGGARPRRRRYPGPSSSRSRSTRRRAATRWWSWRRRG
jgi:type II secretory pathway component GspD/PulD (secretin)